MEDFNKPKIIWKRVGSILRFCYDEKSLLTLDSTCFATGKHIHYLVAILNSPIGHYLLKESPKTGTGDLLISVQAVEPIKIPIPTPMQDMTIRNEVDKIIKQGISNDSEANINRIIYSLYGLSSLEIKYIEGN